GNDDGGWVPDNRRTREYRGDGWLDHWARQQSDDHARRVCADAGLLRKVGLVETRTTPGTGERESKALPVAEKGPAMAAALCLAEPGQRYIIYLRQGGTAKLQLADGRYAVERFDPDTGKSHALLP